MYWHGGFVRIIFQKVAIFRLLSRKSSKFTCVLCEKMIFFLNHILYSNSKTIKQVLAFDSLVQIEYFRQTRVSFLLYSNNPLKHPSKNAPQTKLLLTRLAIVLLYSNNPVKLYRSICLKMHHRSNFCLTRLAIVTFCFCALLQLKLKGCDCGLVLLPYLPKSLIIGCH